MALNASQVPTSGGGGPKQAPIEAGNYLARLVQVLDLGLQEQRPYQGQDKPPAHEIMLTYELGTEFMKDDDGNDQEDKPRWISESIPLRNLSQDLAKSTKRAKVFDPDNALNGAFDQMVCKACTVTVVQNPKKGDPTTIYNNVANVTPPMKGIPVPELVNPAKVFDLDAPDMEVFGSLPEWVQTKIKGNLNFNGSLLQRLLAGEEAPQQQQEPAKDACPSANAAAEGGDEGNPW